MNEFVLNGLVKRRAELAGDIENTHEALRKMVLDLESLDATIVQFDPHFQVETIKAQGVSPAKGLEQPGPDERMAANSRRCATQSGTSPRSSPKQNVTWWMS
jgi:hypothetical protein